MNSSWINNLLQPAIYPHPVKSLALMETHLSWIILTGDYAYKIKKPLDLGFADFSTLKLRHAFCQQELRLNRQFHSKLYIDVIPIYGSVDKPVLGGEGKLIEGEPFEYAVKLHQFDQSMLMDTIAKKGELQQPLINSLATELATRHMHLIPTVHTTEGAGTPQAYTTLMQQNFEQIRTFPIADAEIPLLNNIERWSGKLYKQHQDAMQQRLNDGFVKECHGDLHLGNIIWKDDCIQFFDCLEFCDEMRMCDVMWELSWLLMDMQAKGRTLSANRVLNAYMEQTGDYAGLKVLTVYRLYPPLVRAKVALFSCPPQPDEQSFFDTDQYRDFSRYLKLANHYCRQSSPSLTITHGVSGTGKSTIASALAAETGALHIKSDTERKRLFNIGPLDRSGPEKGIYSSDASAKTYQRLLTLATICLENSFACIADATFTGEAMRAQFRELAMEKEVPFIILNCQTEPDIIQQRLIQRSQQNNDTSDADVAVYKKQLAEVEALTTDELITTIAVNSSDFNPQVLAQRLSGKLQN